MTETVTIARHTDGVDPATGNTTRVLVATRYAGKARVKYQTLIVSDRTAAGQPIAVQDVTVSIPHGSPECFEGDDVDVDTSTADTRLPGRRYRIAGAAQTGQTTAHRYPVKELS